MISQILPNLENILSLFMLLSIAVIIFVIIIIAKIIRTYFKNSALAEEQLRKENEDLIEIKNRLSTLEELLKELNNK